VSDPRQAKLDRLRADLDACGGRGIELADEIDELACELGQCVYTLDECRRETHEGWSEEAAAQFL
jgi:hypothetical protein